MIHARKDYNRFQEPAALKIAVMGLMRMIDEGRPLDHILRQELQSLLDSYPRPEECGSFIGEDEPVFLLRAKDALFALMLERYIELLQEHPDPEQRDRMIAAVEGQIKLTEEWLEHNHTKAPDMPEGLN